MTGYLAAQGFAAHGFAAQGLAAAQGFAAHGLHGLTIFFAAQGFAAHGFAAHGFAAHGFAAQGFAVQVATSAVGDGSGAAIAIGAAMASPAPMAIAGIRDLCMKVADFLDIGCLTEKLFMSIRLPGRLSICRPTGGQYAPNHLPWYVTWFHCCVRPPCEAVDEKIVTANDI